jgi:excisionase family DNA binding protein
VIDGELDGDDRSTLTIPRSGLLRYEDAARYLTCSESTFKRLVRSGCIPKSRISAGVVRFRVADLDAHVERGTRLALEFTPWPQSSRRRTSR